MSDTTAKTDAQRSDNGDGVSMRKPSRTSKGAEPAPKVTPPKTIDLACGALITVVVGLFVRALLLLGSTPVLKDYVTKVNNDAKKPDKNFNVDDAVHQVRSGAFIQALIFGVVLLLLVWSLRRTRSASGTRWALLIVFVYTGMWFYVIPSSGLPVAPQVAGVIIGLAAIAAILLVFVPPQSQKYFRECREANTPPELRGQPRPGLASLFGPRRQRPGATGTGAPGATRPATTRPASTEATRAAGASRSRAKVRADSEAVARGAELARARAKASKSRRTTD